MAASIPPWSSGLTTAGASRSPRAIASRSTSTRCCGRGWSRTGSPRRRRSTRPTRCRGRCSSACTTRALLARIRDGELSVREQRGLGLPWSPQLVERARRSVAGTLAAARAALEHGVAMNLGGGTHHAGRAFARGYCLFNDVVAALGELRADGLAERALVVDCDVHQGDGTADLLGPDPHAFTVSLHGARNYPFQRVPSDLDVDLPSGTGDADYLEALDGRARRRPAPLHARDRVLPRGRRPVGGRPPRPPLAHQGRAARPRRARARPPARRRRERLRRARRRLRRGRPRHRRHQRGDRRRGRGASASKLGGRPGRSGNGSTPALQAGSRGSIPLASTPRGQDAGR